MDEPRYFANGCCSQSTGARALARSASVLKAFAIFRPMDVASRVDIDVGTLRANCRFGGPVVAKYRAKFSLRDQKPRRSPGLFALIRQEALAPDDPDYLIQVKPKKYRMLV